jgi:hypothetical protein
VRVAATAGAQHVVRFRDLLVDRTLGGLTAKPTPFSPNGDGRRDLLGVAFELSRPADVRVSVLRGETRVRRLVVGSLAAGPQHTVWDGRLADGRRAPNGAYRIRVRATTSLGTRTLSQPVALDTRAPVVRILSARLVRGVTRIRLLLSERARLRIWYGTERWSDGDSIVVTRLAGERRVRRRVRAGVIRVVPRDAARNVGRPVVAHVD